MTQHAQEHSQSNLNEPPMVYRIKQYEPPSLLSQFSYMLIRPPRFMYNEKLLNPPEKYKTAFKVEQHLLPFKLTLYKTKDMLYVILYLHGNSSSRFEGYMHLRELPPGVGLACFDFSGCGNRFETDFITLGYQEAKEVDIAAAYLKKLGHRVVGWGRSMGSVSLLLSNQCDVMVADSPFYSLQDLCKESSRNFIPEACCCFFHCLYPCLFACVKSDVQKRAGLVVEQMEVASKIASNPRNKQRSLFLMAGTEDNMICFTHSQKIYAQFPGKKRIHLFEGTHNSQRPNSALDAVFEFIQEELEIKRPRPAIPTQHSDSATTIKFRMAASDLIQKNPTEGEMQQFHAESPFNKVKGPRKVLSPIKQAANKRKIQQKIERECTAQGNHHSAETESIIKVAQRKGETHATGAEDSHHQKLSLTEEQDSKKELNLINKANCDQQFYQEGHN